MTIRPYRASDDARLKEIYAEMGFSYQFPNLSEPQFVNIQVAEDDGVVVGAIASRMTVETYLLMDKGWKTPGWRQEILMQLHLSAHKAVKALGYTDANAWVPPEVVKSFGRRLQRVFGWKRSVWEVFSKEL